MDYRKVIKLIAVWQVLGGVHGLITFPQRTSYFQGVQETSLIIDYIFIAVLIISIVSGILLFLQKRVGFLLSIFLQLFQIVRFVFGPLNYGLNLFFSLGIFLYIDKAFTIGIDLKFFKTYLLAHTNFVYKFSLYLPFHVTLNLSSLLCFVYLCLLYDQIFPRSYTFEFQEVQNSGNPAGDTSRL